MKIKTATLPQTHSSDILAEGTFHGGDAVPAGTFHGGDSVTPGTFHQGEGHAEGAFCGGGGDGCISLPLSFPHKGSCDRSRLTSSA